MKQLNLAVCDDDEYELVRIRDMLLEIAANLGCKIDVAIYRKSQDLIDFINRYPQHFDMFFLDMYIDEKIGLDIAETIRQQDYHCAIVFVTAFEDRMAESFRYLTSAYLTKPIDRPKLESAFQTALSHLHETPCFCFCAKGIDYAIPFCKIMYLESRLKNIYLFSDQEEKPMHLQGKLTDVKSSFPKEFFFFCHKSFLVNFSYIRMVDKVSHTVVLCNGKRLPVSRTYYQQLLKDFTKFHSVRRVEHNP